MDQPLQDIDKVLNLAYIRKHSQVHRLLNKIAQKEINLIDDIKVEHIEEDTEVTEAIKKTIAEADNLLKAGSKENHDDIQVEGIEKPIAEGESLLKAGTKENHHVNSERLQEYLITMKLNSSPLYNLLEELTG